MVPGWPNSGFSSVDPNQRQEAHSILPVKAKDLEEKVLIANCLVACSCTPYLTCIINTQSEERPLIGRDLPFFRIEIPLCLSLWNS